MILGIGCDIVKISRFARGLSFLTHFLKKHFTLAEIDEIKSETSNLEETKLVMAIATRFSGKESVSKALGSGFQNGITLKDIEILHDELGCPHVNLYNQALSRAYFVSKNQQFVMHITLSNEKEFTNSVAVMESI
jgi:holo-[acyl-carrier protein] synthase